MDPSRKCPARMDQLRFTFGEIPPKEREDYRELQSTIEKVEALRLVTFELGVLSQAVSQCQIDVSNKQREVMPHIRVYEGKLNDLKRKADAIRGEAKKKRKLNP